VFGKCTWHMCVLPSDNDINVGGNIKAPIAVGKEFKIMQDMLCDGLDFEDLELGEMYYI
jgi:hypothetical protein